MANDDDIEVLIRLGITFIEASKPDALSLPGGMMFTEFCKCLGDIVLDTYDNIIVGVEDRTTTRFCEVLGELISNFAEPTAFADQKWYIDNYKKPFKLTVRELANRLIIINKYTQYLPGSGGNCAYDNIMIKYALFNMMLPQWQLNFAGTTHTELSDENYTYQQLTQYMVTQETISNQQLSITSTKCPNNYNNGNNNCRGNRKFHPYRNLQQQQQQQTFRNTFQGKQQQGQHHSQNNGQNNTQQNRNQQGNQNNQQQHFGRNFGNQQFQNNCNFHNRQNNGNYNHQGNYFAETRNNQRKVSGYRNNNNNYQNNNRNNNDNYYVNEYNNNYDSLGFNYQNNNNNNNNNNYKS